MKRFAISVAVLLFGVVGVMAQDATPTVTAPCTIYAPKLDDSSTKSTFAITFRSLKQALALPVVNDGETSTVLSCNASPEQVALIVTSPSAQLNQPIPSSDNPEGLAEAQSGYAIVNIEAANLRTADGPQYTKVGVVNGGDKLIVLGHNAESTWWYVQAGELRGWIWGDLIVLRGDLTDTPTVTSVGEISPVTFYVGWEGNPLYDGLQISSQVICYVQGNVEFLVLGQSFNNNWIYVRAICLDGTEAEGWIGSDRGFIRNPADLRIPVLDA